MGETQKAVKEDETNPAKSSPNRVTRKQENLVTVGSWESKLNETEERQEKEQNIYGFRKL